MKSILNIFIICPLIINQMKNKYSPPYGKIYGNTDNNNIFKNMSDISSENPQTNYKQNNFSKKTDRELNDQLKLEIQKRNKQISQLYNQRNTLKSQIQKYKKQIKNFENQSLEDLNQKKSLDIKIKKLEDEIKSKNDQILTMRIQLKKFKDQNQEQNKLIAKLTQEKQEFEKIFQRQLGQKQREWQIKYKNYQRIVQKQQQIILKAIFPSSKSVKIYLQTSNKNFLSYKIKIYQINPSIGKNHQLEYQKNQIVIDKLNPQTQYRFEVLLKTMTNSSKYISNPLFYFRTTSLQQIFMPLDMKSEDEKRYYVIKQLDQLKRTLVLDTDFPELKITLFGSIGQGKSSILNTFNSIIKGKYDPISITGNSNKSITRQARKIRDILSTKVPLSIIDIFGVESDSKMDKDKAFNPLESTNYKQIFNYFYDGSLYETYKVDQTLDRDKLVHSSDGIDRLSRQIHAVIYVISYKMLQNQDQIIRTKYILKLLQQRDLNPVIALTKCDQIIDAPISELESNQKSKNIIEQMMKRLPQVKREDIFIISNYTSNFKKRDFNKEYFMLNMFQEVVIRAKKRLQWKLQKFFWLQKQDQQNYYGVIQQVGLENYGSRIEEILRKSFENRNIGTDRLMFLKSYYSGGQKLEKWVTPTEFFKSPLIDFIYETQNRKIIKIKESNKALLGQTSLLKIPIYDPVLNKKLGIVNLGKMSIEQCEKFYELENVKQKQFSILKNNLKLNDKSTKLSEVLKQNFLPVKVDIKVENGQVKNSNKYFTINFKEKQNRQKCIYQLKMPKKDEINARQFYDLIRKKNSTMLYAYRLCQLENDIEIPEDDTILQQCVIIEGDTITIYMKKK